MFKPEPDASQCEMHVIINTLHDMQVIASSNSLFGVLVKVSVAYYSDQLYKNMLYTSCTFF